jgi:NADH:quinone reductase (non-electrogenic)
MLDIDPNKRRVLVLGGGFAGAYTALHLERELRGDSDVEIVLVAKENFVLFTPMLHEVAGADLSVTDIVQPLRKMLRRTRVGIADVESIDLVKKVVRVRHPGMAEEFDLNYDQLVLALGAVTNFYRTPGLEEHALTMKSLGDAILVRNRVIDALGVAENQVDDDDRKKMLTVVVAGGGFAGTETAGAVNDLFLGTLKFYRHLYKGLAHVVLVHPGDYILPELSESLGRYAEKKLTERGVEVRLKTRVTGYDGQEVSLNDGTKIPTRMLIWTAGITPSPLISTLPCATQRGRIVANEYLQVPDWPGVWALGDCALVPDPLNPGKFYPPTAQHAIREAKVLAQNIAATIRAQPPRPFKFKMIGSLAAIGRRCGVAEIYGFKFSGVIAWWMWRGIYLAKLPGVQNKVRVAIDWTLDLIFSKDIVELPTLQAPTMSESDATSSTKLVTPVGTGSEAASTEAVKGHA